MKNLTQLELAQQAGLSEDYISQIERGKAFGITISTALLISKTLGIELEKLTKEESND